MTIEFLIAGVLTPSLYCMALLSIFWFVAREEALERRGSEPELLGNAPIGLQVIETTVVHVEATLIRTVDVREVRENK